MFEVLLGHENAERSRAPRQNPAATPTRIHERSVGTGHKPPSSAGSWCVVAEPDLEESPVPQAVHTEILEEPRINTSVALAVGVHDLGRRGEAIVQATKVWLKEALVVHGAKPVLQAAGQTSRGARDLRCTGRGNRPCRPGRLREYRAGTVVRETSIRGRVADLGVKRA